MKCNVTLLTLSVLSELQWPSEDVDVKETLSCPHEEAENDQNTGFTHIL